LAFLFPLKFSVFSLIVSFCSFVSLNRYKQTECVAFSYFFEWWIIWFISRILWILYRGGFRFLLCSKECWFFFF
jgi:hypothetical protein